MELERAMLVCQAVLERSFSEEVSRKAYCSSSCTKQLSAQIGKRSFLLVCRCSDVKVVNRVFLHLPWAGTLALLDFSEGSQSWPVFSLFFLASFPQVGQNPPCISSCCVPWLY